MTNIEKELLEIIDRGSGTFDDPNVMNHYEWERRIREIVSELEKENPELSSECIIVGHRVLYCHFEEGWQVVDNPITIKGDNGHK